MQPAPAEPPHLPALLARQSRRQVAAVGLSNVRRDVGWLAEWLLAERARGAELLVVDALDDADLRAVLDACLRVLPDALLCGSAGLAGTLAAYVARLAPLPNAAQAAPVAGPALLVIGSGSPMARRQIEYLRCHQIAAAFELGADLPAGIAKDLLLHLPAPPPSAVLDGPVARRLAEKLAAAALPLIDAARPGLLVLSGGDTAIGVLASMGVKHLMVQRELLPGVPLTFGVDSGGRSHAIVLKPGSFGDEAALATVLERARS
jgi:uncharacterized protein YgbK (DUF1537 family)